MTNSGPLSQVDVHVCRDREEWSRVGFFRSYGDMGMMLGLIARNIGLRLGETGLKVRYFEPVMIQHVF